MQTTKIGNKAEDQACKFLRLQGLQILFQNFRALPYGEIDIIAFDSCDNTHAQRDSGSESGMTIQSEADTLIFIEVKYRKRTKFAKAEEMLTYSKQQKLINAANIFLQQNPEYENCECRFDLVAINEDKIDWIKDAFQAV